ncbi:MAG: hypothetical protein AB7O21_01645 [Gammaproteobacteria bacterium]
MPNASSRATGSALFTRRALLAICVICLIGCSHLLSPGEERRQKKLAVATETYRKLLRWGYYEEAAQYLKGNGEEVSRPDLAQLARYKISGYHASEELRNDTGDEVRLIALIDYYEIDSGNARTLRDEQYWWYDAEAERWYLGSPMPALGAR